MTKTKTFGARVIIRDKDLIPKIAQAKAKLFMDGKIRDSNISYVEYCVLDTTNRILEEY